MKVLVIDVGGQNIKIAATGCEEKVKIPSGIKMTPRRMVEAVRKAVASWDYGAISLGYPGPVAGGKPAAEPCNLAPGWVGFDYEGALGKPVRILNDAAMQALGSYEGGRMLFLGLGTGLGSALVFNKVLIPLELGELRFARSERLEDVLGRAGLKEMGRKKWGDLVCEVVARMRIAFMADYVVLGGGNVKRLETLPPGIRRGHNQNAFLGGEALWQHDWITADPRSEAWTLA